LLLFLTFLLLFVVVSHQRHSTTHSAFFFFLQENNMTVTGPNVRQFLLNMSFVNAYGRVRMHLRVFQSAVSSIHVSSFVLLFVVCLVVVVVFFLSASQNNSFALTRDGEADPSFAIANFLDGNWVNVGRWVGSQGLTWTSPVTWPDGMVGTNPGEIVPRKLKDRLPMVYSVAYAVAAVCFFFSLSFHYLINAYKDHEVIKGLDHFWFHPSTWQCANSRLRFLIPQPRVSSLSVP